MIRCFWLLTLTLPAFSQEPEAFTGNWAGTIATIDLEVDVDLVHEDGAWSGDVSIPAQAAKDLPLKDIALEDGTLTFVIDGVPGDPKFTAQLQGEDVLTGKFEQAAFSATFTLERNTSRVPATLAALEELDPWLDELMATWDVPGLGLAIVRDGEIVRVTGHGMRDVEAGQPVTEDTLFAIGSSSKAFTTMTLAILAGEGKFDWDDPLIDHLPGLKLNDEFATNRLTPRDMASHQSGLPRHDLAWYGRTEFGLEEIFTNLRHYEPTAELRETWQYNNLMYATLGYLVEQLDGRSWEESVRARVLDPLGMPRTNFSVADSAADSNHALPYDEREDELTAIPFRDISHVGPAGSINSSAKEMAQWALLQLSDGSLGDVTILPEANLTELHTPRAVMGGLPSDPELAPSLYGMGWMIDGYRGHLRIHHGGNIDGFSALVTFFPHDDLGIVVLTNRNATPVGEFVVRQVADRVFGHDPKDWSGKAFATQSAAKEALADNEEETASSRVEGTAPSHPIADYAGSFECPGYGPMNVTLEGERLTAEYNGLGGPLEHWHYDVFRMEESADNPALGGTKLRYESNLEGEIAALYVSLEPTLPALRFDRAPDPQLSDPAYLARFAGNYDLLGTMLEVHVVDDHLTVNATGQGPTKLAPLWNDTFIAADAANAKLSFTVEDGVATGLTLHQAGQTFSATRQQD